MFVKPLPSALRRIFGVKNRRPLNAHTGATAPSRRRENTATMRKSSPLVVALLLIAAVILWPRLSNRSDTSASVAPAAHTPASAIVAPSSSAVSPTVGKDARLPDFLPAQAADTIRAIQAGGPFAHRQDGSVFGNREGHLPKRPRGYYREYTVDTPGLDHRGARRIVTGGDPPETWYYSDDHYDSFRPFTPTAIGERP